MTHDAEDDRPGRHVYGAVRTLDRIPVAGVTVLAFDRDLGDGEPLGPAATTTDDAGRYDLPYGTERLRALGKDVADLVVRVFADDPASLGDSLLIDREEYIPYGETSFGGFPRKRFRFTGKERDEEDGLYYQGARYYSPWTGRWISCDPAALVVEKPAGAPPSPVSGYLYAAANPLAFVDRDGNAARSFYVTLPYESFRDQDTGGYLRNTGTYAEQLAAKKTRYERISAKSLDDMVEQINSRLEPGDTIKNL
jgi:RHS repeat-associated protein